MIKLGAKGKIILLVSLFASLLLAIIGLFELHEYRTLFLALLSFPIILVITSLAFFLDERVFEFWLKFAYFWVPLTIALVLIAPTYGDPFLRINKPNIAIFANALFVVISLLLIGWKSYQLRKREKI